VPGLINSGQREKSREKKWERKVLPSQLIKLIILKARIDGEGNESLSFMIPCKRSPSNNGEKMKYTLICFSLKKTAVCDTLAPITRTVVASLKKFP
jgi:hypothetical protein